MQQVREVQGSCSHPADTSLHAPRACARAINLNSLYRLDCGQDKACSVQCASRLKENSRSKELLMLMRRDCLHHVVPACIRKRPYGVAAEHAMASCLNLDMFYEKGAPII